MTDQVAIVDRLPRKDDRRWTPERLDQLRGYLAAGMSAREASDKLGVTRNVVIGQATRHGIPFTMQAQRPKSNRPPRVPRKPGSPPRQQNPVHIVRSIVTGVYASADPNKPRPEHTEPEALKQFNDAIPKRQRKGLGELGFKQCCWPVGNPGRPGFFFCGGKTAAGSRYCMTHAAAARPTVRT